jgi:coenzyme F420-0:L-glutamate ligase/coenzyme F420-1:gamma-L-glutamate ligase
MSLMITTLPDAPFIQTGDDLATIILSSLEKANISLMDNDILDVTQKIVSKAEGRFVNLAQVEPSEAGYQLAAKTEQDPRLVELILRVSRSVLRARPRLIIGEPRLDIVCVRAWIDHSNRQGEGEYVLLLTEDPDASAGVICTRLEKVSGGRLGVMIIDSHGRAWWLGTVGLPIDLAELPGVGDLRGQSDIFGYALRIMLIGAVHELAAAASLVMGQATEWTPVVHARGFPYPLREGFLQELLRPVESDLFR